MMILLTPVKTEKAIGMIEKQNSLSFEVMANASKKDVKTEVEKVFGVKVFSVRTSTSRGRKIAMVRLDKAFKADDLAIKLKMVA